MYHEEINKHLELISYRGDNVLEKIPDTLPLLGAMKKDLKINIPSLENFNLLLIQHHLAHFMPRLKALFKDGFRKENTWLIDIPYSTSKEVMEYISSEFHEIPPHQIAPPLNDPLAPYSDNQLRRVENMIHYLKQHMDGRQLLVIDDGAYFTRALKEMNDLEPGTAKAFRGRTYIVEQTTRGHRYLEGEHPGYKEFIEEYLKAPVVSIAKCKTKKEFEAPFIGAAARDSLLDKLDENDLKLTDFKRIAIIGFGPVGKAVYLALHKEIGNKVIVIDTDKKQRAEVRSLEGKAYKTFPRGKKFDLVIGCTGHKSFKLSDWNHLAKRAYLASASSATVEFNRKRFIDLAQLRDDGHIQILRKNDLAKEGILADITIMNRKRNRTLTFLNGSFPVNFNGKMESQPLQVIQATHTLLYFAGYQAIRSQQPGLSDINTKHDGQIYDAAIKELKNFPAKNH